MELFSDARLPCPQRVHLVIQELGLDVPIRELRIESQAHKDENYLKLNPWGAVPCLVDSTLTPPLILYESRAIARYLAMRYGQGKLVPDVWDIRNMALLEQAASIELATFDPVANRLVFEETFKPVFTEGTSASPNVSLISELRSRLTNVFRTLNNILGEQAYMAGNDCTIVDLFYMPYMYHLATSVWPSAFEEHQNINRWWQLMKERPSFEVVRRDDWSKSLKKQENQE